MDTNKILSAIIPNESIKIEIDPNYKNQFGSREVLKMDHKSKPATTKEVLEELREMIEIL